jgi:3-oxoisoapionate kinase
VAGLRHVWYGDDFTGASDTLATFAGAGLRTMLFLGIPSPRHLETAGALDTLGIAGAARTMSPAAMEAELVPVGRFLASLRAPVLHYKCCSTFDSSPTVGNLGAALRILKREVRNDFVSVVGGQPSLGRYCAFGNLFASMGGSGEVYRIDRHPTMCRHPVTPMQEADLRRHLAMQGFESVALVDLLALAGTDDAALDAVIDAALAGKPDAVLFDVVDSAHLARIGGVLWRRARREPLLALGASSVAQALIAHWRSRGELREPDTTATVSPAKGPVFVLAGSQSPITAGQIEAARVARNGAAPLFECVAIDADAIVGRPAALEAATRTCVDILDRGRGVLAHTMPVRDGGSAPLEVAAACGRLLAKVLSLAPRVRRAGVAGGDSSSLAVQALGGWALSHAGALAPGVSLTRLHSDAPRLDGLELMLKGGQMGSPDLFERLVRGGNSPQRTPGSARGDGVRPPVE